MRFPFFPFIGRFRDDPAGSLRCPRCKSPLGEPTVAVGGIVETYRCGQCPTKLMRVRGEDRDTWCTLVWRDGQWRLQI